MGTISIFVIVLNALFVVYLEDIHNSCIDGQTTLAIQKYEARILLRGNEKFYVEDSNSHGKCIKKSNFIGGIINVLSSAKIRSL